MRRSSRTHGAVFVLFLAAIPLYYALPKGGLAQAAVFLGVVGATLALVVRRTGLRAIRSASSWRSMVLAYVVYLVASFGWYLPPVAFDAAPSFPAWPDALYLLAYGLLGLFLWSQIAQSEATDEVRAAVVDVGIFTCALVAVAWVLLIEPRLDDEAVTAPARAAAVAYAIATSLLFALAARLCLRRRFDGFGVLLMLWAGGPLGAAIVYGYESARGSFEFGSVVFLGWFLSYASLAALAAHPQFASQRWEPGQRPSAGWSRTATLGAAALVPACLATQTDAGTGSVLFLTLVVSLMTLLIVLRLARAAGPIGRKRDLAAELRAATTALKHQGLHDALTGLGNRQQLMQLGGRSGDPGNRSFVLIDLDDFKAINYKFGHAVGDGVLQAVADRLAAVVRPGDFVFRLGGDEFAVLLLGADATVAERVASRFLDEIERPLDIEGQRILVKASAGVAFPDAGDTLDSLMHKADVSMHHVKLSPRYRRVSIFTPSTHREIFDNLALANDLHHAVDLDEFLLLYQPIVTAEDRRTVGFEALVRWRHPTRGLIGPVHFIPLVEQGGLMSELGEWILRTACAEARTWAEFREDPPYVSVNLSVRQLQDPTFEQRFDRALRDCGLPPDRLVVEITETALASDLRVVVGPLESLRRRGVRVHIDDFGTGYSSLGYIRELPLDGVKLDRLFTRDLTSSAEALSLAQAVVGLLEQLNLAMTAEGIESAAQLAQLRSLGCRYAQGYYFARPQPAEALARSLVRR